MLAVAVHGRDLCLGRGGGGVTKIITTRRGRLRKVMSEVGGKGGANRDLKYFMCSGWLREMRLTVATRLPAIRAPLCRVVPRHDTACTMIVIIIICFLNPCNVVAQLVTSQPFAVDTTMTFFSYTDVLGPSRITRKQLASSIVHSVLLHVLCCFVLLSSSWRMGSDVLQRYQDAVLDLGAAVRADVLGVAERIAPVSGEHI